MFSLNELAWTAAVTLVISVLIGWICVDFLIVAQKKTTERAVINSLAVLVDRLGSESIHGFQEGWDVSRWEEAVFEAAAYLEEREREASKLYRAFTKDVEKHGLRCDTTPTFHMKDKEQVYRDFSEYLKNVDNTLRARAKNALVTPEDI